MTQYTIIPMEKSQSSFMKMKPPINSNGTSRTRSKHKSSNVWKHIETYFDEKRSERAKSIYCSKSFAYVSSSHGTKNLKHHMEDCFKSVTLIDINYCWIMRINSKLKRFVKRLIMRRWQSELLNIIIHIQ